MHSVYIPPMQQLHDFISLANSYIWGPPMLVLLMGTHLWFTVRLKGIQRFIPLGIKLSVTREKGASGDVSPFGALTTAVALGGPGAVLWMWLTGVFGIATKYAEALLAVKYRVKDADGHMQGGTMYALERGLGWKKVGIFFAFAASVAAFGIGNMVQANSLASLANRTWQVESWVTGLVLAIITGIVLVGGYGRCF